MSITPLTKLTRLIEELRKLDPEMPAQTAIVFLTIAAQPGISQTDAGKVVGLSKSAISRVFTKLSDIPGGNLGVIRMSEDNDDRRQKVAHLTPKGTRVMASLEHILGD